MRFLAIGEEVDICKVVLDQQGRNTVLKVNGTPIVRLLSETRECEVLREGLATHTIALKVVDMPPQAPPQGGQP